MWRHLLYRSLAHRKGRLGLAILIVALGAGLVSALANLTPNVTSKAAGQLRAYGANILILPQPLPGMEGMGYLEETGLAYLETEKEAIDSYVPFLYSLAEVAGQRAVVVGTWLDGVQRQSPWWQVQGAWPASRGDAQSALLGAQLARKLGLGVGQKVHIRTAQGERSFSVIGLVETGAAEEEQVFLGLPAAQGLTGTEGKVSLVQVSALSPREPLTKLAQRLELAIPGSEVRVVGQVAKAEAQVLEKVRLLMLLVASLVLVASGLAIFSAMTASLLERTKEIGLMKALGATDGRVARFFAAEILLMALGGGLLGYGLGYGLAQLITLRVFAAPAALHWPALLITLLAAVLVTFLGSALPVRRALRLDPAVTLREE